MEVNVAFQAYDNPNLVVIDFISIINVDDSDMNFWKPMRYINTA